MRRHVMSEIPTRAIRNVTSDLEGVVDQVKDEMDDWPTLRETLRDTKSEIVQNVRTKYDERTGSLNGPESLYYMSRVCAYASAILFGSDHPGMSLQVLTLGAPFAYTAYHAGSEKERYRLEKPVESPRWYTFTKP